MTIEEIEELIAKNGSITAQPLMDLIVTVVLEAVEAEREACALTCEGEDIMNSYAENLRRSIVNTTRRFKEMTDELKANQDAADREEIVRMARETGFDVNFDIRAVSVEGVFINKELERFANLVAAAEREACAKVCEEYRDEWLKGRGRYEFMGEGADYLADFIRARGDE